MTARQLTAGKPYKPSRPGCIKSSLSWLFLRKLQPKSHHQLVAFGIILMLQTMFEGNGRYPMTIV